MEVTRYTVTAERGRRRWSLQAVEAPGAISEVNRLSQAVEYIREAIAFVEGIPEEEVEVDLVTVLPAQVRDHLERAEELREQAAHANAEAAAERRAAARELKDDGLSVREIGEVLKVSYQRAQQLVSA